MKLCPQCGKAFDDSPEVCAVDRSELILIDPGDPDPMLGRLLDGRYRLIRKIGQGGMGAIYRAVHTEMSRTCAIKLLTALSPGNDDAIARFKREAKNSSRIDNIHAVTIYDFGQTEDGLLFLVMELIDGQPLSRLIADQRVMQIDRVVHITNQIAEALAAAHALGIVHRDLKPDNVMITRRGSDADFVKVLDFGIAKTVADEGADNLTKTGFVLGTPVYMSPEQLMGETLDGRSDIYSLAIIAYEMLSGRLPFEGENPQAVMMKRVMSQPIRLGAAAPAISESVERAVMEGLERDRDLRTSEVQAFADGLSWALHSGTQVMGGAVTGRLGGLPGAPRATNERVSYETRSETGAEGFTGKPSSAVSSDHDGVKAFAATEISFSPEGANRIALTRQPQPAIVDNPDDLPDRGLDSPDAVVYGERPRRPSKLIWGGGVVVVAVIAVILYLIISPSSSSGFSLVVKGAPPGSQVFINEARRDTVANDGGLKVSGLDPGKLNLRVSHEGFADFITTISGAKGEVQTCEAQLLPEIDYNGLMVPIPAGEFLMGDDSRGADERPAHKVTLPAFYIDKYEVTNAQYKKFCDATGRAYPISPLFDKDYINSSPDSPVISVTWDDAAAFASWAGKRLPTEEEWEKAASWDSTSQKKRVWPWGSEANKSIANIEAARPAPVKEYPRDVSAYGVFGMGGNAAEWVNDFYGPYPGNQTPDPQYGQKARVMRGGNYKSTSLDEARTTSRDYISVTLDPQKTRRPGPIGFRCAISADDTRVQPTLQLRMK
jgi:serine/threonine protein kinase/formylglycine-generating enzyme required for sulfatase activity